MQSASNIGTCGDHCCRTLIADKSNLISLADAAPGDVGVLCHSELDGQDSELLRAMGLRPQARVRVCRLGEPCIVEVFAGGGSAACRCRIGLSKPLARRVLMEPVGER